MHTEEKTNEPPLLSRSSILIISAFLVGMAAGEIEHRLLFASLGLGGLVLYFGYESCLRLRAKFLELRHQMTTEKVLSHRLQRHDPRKRQRHFESAQSATASMNFHSRNSLRTRRTIG